MFCTFLAGGQPPVCQAVHGCILHGSSVAAPCKQLHVRRGSASRTQDMIPCLSCRHPAPHPLPTGNDFLPHVPSLDIYDRPSALETLLDKYKVTARATASHVL